MKKNKNKKLVKKNNSIKDKGKRVKTRNNFDYKNFYLEELKFLGVMFIIFYAAFQIHYYKENPFLLLKTVFAHFYLFIVPGYFLCLYFYENIGKIERFIIGIGVGYGLQPFLAYLINYIIKVNMMVYNKYLSAFLIILGIIIFKLKKK